MELDGQIAIVTGAGSKDNGLGTGKAIALLFAQEGARVVLVDRHEDRVAETCRLIEDAGGKASVVVADLRGEGDCQMVVDEAVSVFGGVDILVNNAAAFAGARLLDVTSEMLAECVAVNLTVPLMLSKAAVPRMIARRGGSILNVTSIVAMRGPGTSVYASTKAAVIGLTTSLANELGTQGIRVNCIAPGVIDTPIRTVTSASVGGAKPQTATGADGDAGDVARAALLLASPRSKHLTGVLLPVDGGATTRMGMA